jgi:Uma2 family endonuclease
MGSLTADYRDAVDHLCDGMSLVIHGVSWDDYERLLESLADRPRLRTCYDNGRLEIMAPLPAHEAYARFIDRIVYEWCERTGLTVESYGGATWKRQALAKGAEPDACYYVANAARIIGKREFDLDIDPAPDIVVEIDITNESLGKFPIYAALGVPEIWRYDESRVSFHGLQGQSYGEILVSQFLPGLTPNVVRDTLERAKTDGQTASLAELRRRL